MINKTFFGKINQNKSNNQLTFSLPKRKFKMLKDKTPKRIKFKIEGIEW